MYSLVVEYLHFKEAEKEFTVASLLSKYPMKSQRPGVTNKSVCSLVKLRGMLRSSWSDDLFHILLKMNILWRGGDDTNNSLSIFSIAHFGLQCVLVNYYILNTRILKNIRLPPNAIPMTPALNWIMCYIICHRFI